jgi:hypothetical protein
MACGLNRLNLQGADAWKKEAARVIIACGILEPELEVLRRDYSGVEVRYVDQEFHRVPARLRDPLQDQIDRVAVYAAEIVLGFGLCSKGLAGVVAPRQGLLVPKCHDCIAFSLGSPAAYMRHFSAHPGTFYLTPGWVAKRKDPLSIVEDEYTPRYGKDVAMWAMREELKHYSHMAFIAAGIIDESPLKERAKENCTVFGKAYEEVPGSGEYLRRFFQEGQGGEYFFFIPPGGQVTVDIFLADEK